MSKTNKRERVTFWVVDYYVMGALRHSRATFDDKARADAFYNGTQLCDTPVRRWCSNPDTVESYREAVSRTEAEHGGRIDYLMDTERMEDIARVVKEIG